MGRDVVTAKLDIIFKKFFGENKDMLKSFLSSMLRIPLESISNIDILNPEMTPDVISNKVSRLDLNMSVDGKLVNVEIQVRNESGYRDRSLYYWAKLFTSGLKKGEEYIDLKKAITINIINFNLFPDRMDYHTEIVPVIRDTDEIFSEKMSIHFCELKKINRKPNANDNRELWLQFINADSEEDFEMLKQTNVADIIKAVDLIYEMSDDREVREMVRLREKALHDEASMIGEAKREGRAEGRAEGRVSEQSRIAENLRRLGYSESEIAKIINS